MTPTIPSTTPPAPEPAPEKPRVNAVQRAALSGAIGLCVCPEPVTGLVIGVVASVGKTLINAARAAGPSPRARATAAKRRYRTALKLLARSGLGGFELAAAREAARQRYLRDLAEALT